MTLLNPERLAALKEALDLKAIDAEDFFNEHGFTGHEIRSQYAEAMLALAPLLRELIEKRDVLPQPQRPEYINDFYAVNRDVMIARPNEDDDVCFAVAEEFEGADFIECAANTVTKIKDVLEDKNANI